MVQKQKIRDTRELAATKVIGAVLNRKFVSAESLVKKHFKPNSSTALFFKAWILQLKNEHIEAIKLFEKALSKDPKNIDALTGLVVSYLAIGNLSFALECASHAMLLAPSNIKVKVVYANVSVKANIGNTTKQLETLNLFNSCIDSLKNNISLTEEEYNHLLIDAYIGKSACLIELKLYSDAETELQKVLKLEPTNILAHKNLVTIYTLSNKIDKAIDSCKVVQLSSDREEVESSLFQEGMLRLYQEDFSSGWRLYEHRLNCNSYKPTIPSDIPKWDGNKLESGEKLLVYQEQGIGDFLQFSRYFPYLKLLANFDVEIRANTYQPWIKADPPSIKEFIRYNYKSVDNIYIKGYDSHNYSDYACAISIMSLPYIFKTNASTIPDVPYFKTPVYYEEQYDVGIFWQGSKSFKNDSNRSIPIELIKLFIGANSTKSFLSLQIEEYESLRDLNNFIQAPVLSIEELLGKINCCKLIITVDSMVAHLAAGANKNTVIMHPYSSDWRWGINRSDSLWYPKVLNLRQQSPNNWTEVLVDASLILKQNYY